MGGTIEAVLDDEGDAWLDVVKLALPHLVGRAITAVTRVHGVLQEEEEVVVVGALGRGAAGAHLVVDDRHGASRGWLWGLQKGGIW